VSVTVHVVPHTHWDREWYHPAARFQMRLSRMVSEVARLLRERPATRSFLLDGQAILLDDAVEANPELRDLIAPLLRDGRLEAGPWYVLADELLVSAESLVRNLMTGTATVRRHGGRAMPVGYSPDAFGHSGALPTLLVGFGIDTAVIWRGFGGGEGEEGDLFRWRSPDGAAVLMIHLPTAGYENGANLPANPAAAVERWRALRSSLEPRARSPYWLVLNGADHHGPQPDLEQAVEALDRAAPGVSFQLSGLEDYADAVRSWARDRMGELPSVEGELRRGFSHAWALQGTQGSRLYLKQRNAACQRVLERYAEPLAALAHVHVGADLRGELAFAWRTLLQNHPHDSICGTSADPVHREMMVRFDRCEALSEELARTALERVAGHEPAAARVAGREAWRPALLLFSPSAQSRDAVVEASVALFRADLRVGQQGPRGRTPPGRAGVLEIHGRDGTPVPIQELDRADGFDLVESPRHYPDCDRVEWRRVALLARDLPALGVVALAVREGRGSARGAAGGIGAGDAAGASTSGVVVTGHELRNGILRARVEPGGTLEVTNLLTGLTCRGLGALVDGGDCGDSYTYSVPRSDRVVDTPDSVAARLIHAGPLRGMIEVARRYEAIDLRAVMRVTLDAGAEHLALGIAGENLRRDHRLRAVFRLGERATRVVADAHFGPVERSVRPPRRRKGFLETPPPTAPMQRYVSVGGRARCLTVLTDGLPEYEVRPDGTVLVTLLRSFGELSRADLPERPGHAGWPTPTPDAQCPGPFSCRLGVTVHDAGEMDRRDAIERAAESFHAPPRAWMLRSALAIPGTVRGARLEGRGLVATAVKPAEDGRGVVLRCYNQGTAPTAGAWILGWRVRQAAECRLDETALRPLSVEAGGMVRFEAGPRAVVSVLVR
jgi:alpha-mannosidase